MPVPGESGTYGAGGAFFLLLVVLDAKFQGLEFVCVCRTSRSRSLF